VRNVDRAERRATDREILRLAVPAFGALIAEPLYLLADTAVVGYLGTPQLGGLAVAASALLGGYSIFVFLAYGTTAAVSRLLGAGEHRRAADQAVQSLWLAMIIGLVLVTVGAIWAEPILGAFGPAEEVRRHALVYFRISLAGVPAFLLTMAGVGYLRGLQNTRIPLVVAVATGLVNLIAELVLIVLLDFGIGASALTTVIAQWLGAGVYVVWVLRGAREHRTSLRPSRLAIGRLARTGSALVIRTAALRGSLIVATAVAARVGVTDLAAHQIAFELWGFLAFALDSVAIAGQSMIGKLLGAGDAVGTRRVGWRMIQWGVAMGVGAGLLVAALHRLLPSVFTSDPDVRSLTAFLLLCAAVLQPVNGVVFVLDGILIGAGDMTFLAWAMVGVFVLFLPAALAVVVLDLGIGALWAALAVMMVSRMVFLSLRYRTDAWMVLGADR
jgi:putative MATE family efflux protein